MNPAHDESMIEVFLLEESHLDLVTAIHLKGYEGKTNFSRLMGSAFVRKTYEWFCKSAGRFGYVAFVGKKMAGFIVGAESEAGWLLNKYRLSTALKYLIKHPWALFSKAVVEGLIGKVINYRKRNNNWGIKFNKDQGVYLYSMAVLPEFAKYRVARLLLKKCEEYAKARNKKVVVAPTGGKNIPSLTLFRIMEYTVDKIRQDGENKYLYKVINGV